MTRKSILRLRTFAKRWQWNVQGDLDGPIISLADLCSLALRGLNARPSRRRQRKPL